MATSDEAEANFAPRGSESETIDRRPSDAGGKPGKRDNLAFKGRCDGCNELIPQACEFCMYCGLWRPFDTGYIGCEDPIAVEVDDEVAVDSGGDR